MRWLEGRLEVTQGDLTRLAVDAIVNAANATLLGGGGVDGAIHRAAGPELLRECEGLGGARPGEVKRTSGYRLPARHVLHAVGPIWRGGGGGEDALLASCYREALRLAAAAGAASVAFPAISTGVYGFPKARAAGIAVAEIASGLARHLDLRLVVLCAFSSEDRLVLERACELALGPGR
jgi:O-acetyl-ADP-ribose deacetylase (regulator of RNase III)